MSDYPSGAVIHQLVHSTLPYYILMQTFLSESTFQKSVAVLDNRRLNSQLKESLQIVKVLTDPDAKAWRNHPAVLQWKGYEKALLFYASEAELECELRGIKTDKNSAKLSMFMEQISADSDNRVILPDWWTSTTLSSRVMITHKARLFVKDPSFYSMYENYAEDAKELVCCSHCNYFWPAHYYKNLENAR